MERSVLKYAPSYWDRSYEDNAQFVVRNRSSEYIRLERKIESISNIKVNRIDRNQNVHDYGQFLIREQLMAIAKPHENYYRVRRFITIKRQYLPNALEYNLDHRRCGKSALIFQKHISYSASDDVILVIQVITNTPHCDNIQPSNSSEYFIDYIVYI